MTRPPRRPRDDDDDDDDIRQKPRRRQPQPQSSALPWIIGGVIGGGLLLCCVPVGIIAVALLFAGRAEQVRQVGANPVQVEQPMVIAAAPPKVAAPPPKMAVPVFSKPSTRFRIDGRSMDMKDVAFASSANGVGILSWETKGKITKFFEYWDWKNAIRLTRVEIAEDGILMNVSPKGTRFLTLGINPGKLNVWSLPDGGKQIDNWNPYQGQPQPAINIRPPNLAWADFLDEDRLLAVTNAGQIDLWDLNKKQTSYSVPPRSPFLMLNTDGFMRDSKDVALSSDRKTLAVANTDGFDFFDPATGKPLGKTAGMGPKQKVGNVWSVNFNRAGTLLASRHTFQAPKGPLPEFLTVWDVPTGAKKWQYPIDKNLQLTGPVTFVGAHYVVLWDGNVFKGFVVDLNDGRFHRQIAKEGVGDRLTARTPDGRMWYISGENILAPAEVVAVDFPEKDLTDRPAAPGDANQAPRWVFNVNGISR